MKYCELISNEDNILKLMKKLSIIDEVTKIVAIDHHPDYELSPYQGSVASNYVFKNTINTPSELSFTYSAEILDSRIFHWDNVRDVAKSKNLAHSGDSFSEDVLNQAREMDEEVIAQGFEPDLDGFILNDLKIGVVYNQDKKINIEGSFFGDGYSISPDDWSLYSEIRFDGFTEFNDNELFYVELLINSFHMYHENHYRLSYFLAFSALEGFVNYYNASDDVEEKLPVKLANLFKNKFPDIPLSNNAIYTSCINEFKKKMIPKRNNVAHGRSCSFSLDESLEMLIFSLAIITAITCKKTKLIELF